MNGATLLAKTAALYPEAVAVRHGQEFLRYAQLAEHAARLGVDCWTSGSRRGIGLH